MRVIIHMMDKRTEKRTEVRRGKIYEFVRSNVMTPTLLAAREFCPPRKNSAWCHRKAGDCCKPFEKRAHIVMDRQAIYVIVKNLFLLIGVSWSISKSLIT